jgi:iron(III) transport system ATP-binding protein
LKGLTEEYDGAFVDVLVRPDDLRAKLDSQENNGQIVHRQYNGPSFVYRVELSNGDEVHCEHNHAEDITLDESVRVELDADHSLAWYPSQ